jgi:alanine dehydrogenase
VKLANHGIKALEVDAALAKGLNVKNHQLLHPDVQRDFPDLIP